MDDDEWMLMATIIQELGEEDSVAPYICGAVVADELLFGGQTWRGDMEVDMYACEKGAKFSLVGMLGECSPPSSNRRPTATAIACRMSLLQICCTHEQSPMEQLPMFFESISYVWAFLYLRMDHLLVTTGQFNLILFEQV